VTADNATCDETRTALGAYVLGALEPREHETVATHLDRCPECRVEADELAGLPPLLGTLSLQEVQAGPVRPSSDLLDRVLDRVVAERAQARRRRFLAVAAAVVALVALPAGAAYLTATLDEDPMSSSAPVAAPSPAGAVRSISAENPQTSAAAEVKLTEKRWGTSVDLRLTGVPGPNACQLVVVGADGTRQVAGEWAVPAGGYGEAAPLTLTGAVSFAPDEIVRLEIVTTSGEELVDVEA
jgi:anti-sigma factor RsiW